MKLTIFILLNILVIVTCNTKIIRTVKLRMMDPDATYVEIKKDISGDDTLVLRYRIWNTYPIRWIRIQDVTNIPGFSCQRELRGQGHSMVRMLVKLLNIDCEANVIRKGTYALSTGDFEAAYVTHEDIPAHSADDYHIRLEVLKGEDIMSITRFDMEILQSITVNEMPDSCCT